MKWNLSAPETAGVVGIGLGLSYLGCMLSGADTSYRQKVACTVGGSALYTAGVVIGTNRPKKGFLGKLKKSRKKSRKSA